VAPRDRVGGVVRPQVTCAAQPGRARARAPRRRAAPRAAPRARATGEQWPGPRVSDDLEGVRSCRGASRAPSAVRALSRRRRGSSGRRLSGPREPQSGYSVTPPRRTGVLVLGSPRGSSLRRSYILGAGRPAPPRIAPARRHGSRRAAHELARAGAPFSDGRRRWIASSPPPAPAFLFSFSSASLWWGTSPLDGFADGFAAAGEGCPYAQPAFWPSAYAAGRRVLPSRG